MMIGFNPTQSETIWINKRLSETHKSVTELMHTILEAYRDFEKAGYLGADGNKLIELETKVQLTERLRAVEAAALQDKLNYQRELSAIKEAEAKRRAQDRAVRNEPKVDWGNVAVGSGDNFMLGDE